MPLTTLPVSGNLYYPNGTPMSGALVTFTLQSAGFSPTDPATLPPSFIEVEADSAGSFTVNLWPTTLGSEGLKYTVKVTYVDETTGHSELKLIGKIQTPSEGGPYNLATLLAAESVTPDAVYLGIITQEQYDKVVEASELLQIGIIEDAATLVEALDFEVDALPAGSSATSSYDRDTGLVSIELPRGEDGLSAYEIAVADGYTGTESEWLLTLVGNDGSYTLASEIKDDIESGVITDGDNIYFNGLRFQVDSTLDDDPLSWFYNIKGDSNPGLRAISPVPYNHFLYVSFLTQDLNKVYLYSSADGLNFRTLNNDEIPRGQGNSTVGSRDQSPRWVSELNEWLIPYTNGVGTDFDFGFWRTPDLTVWDSENSFYGTNPTGIRDTILSGGSVPCEYIWSPKLERFDGTWYMVFAAQYGPYFDNPYTGDTGPTSVQFQPFMCEVTDLDTLATSDPVRMDFPHPGGSAPTAGESSMLTPDIFKHTDGYYYAAIKSDYYKNILIYRNTTLTGTWTYLQTIDQDGNVDPLVMDSLEGPIWQAVRYVDASDHTLKIKHRLMMSDNRDADNNLVEKYVYVEFDDGPAGAYSAIDDLKFDTPTRNGGIVNLAMEDDPRALLSVQAAQSAFGGHGATDIRVAKLLEDGVDLYPQQDTLYYWRGSTDLNITIHKTRATRFWLQCESFAGALLYVSGDDVVQDSFGHNGEDCYEMRWMPHVGDGKYLRVGGAKNNSGGGSATAGAYSGATQPKVQGMVGIAHRGMSGAAPENTLPAYTLAVSNGFKYLEGDLRMTSDGVWVMLHDATVDRTSDGTGNIADITLATARTYDFGSWKNAAYAGTEIPTAEEFFNLCFRQNAIPVIEVKFRATQAEIDQLVDIAVAAGVGDRIIYSSFESEDMELVLNKDPKANVAHISSAMSTELIAEAVALKTGQNNVSMVLNNANITAALAEDALAAGLTMFAYTVNDSSLLRGLSEKGVTGVITDTLNIASLLEGLDGVSGTEGGSFDYSKLVPGVFFNNPHYEYSGTTLYVKPSAFGATSNVAYIRGGSLPDDEWTYAELKADLAAFTAPSFAATGITSPSGVTDCIRLGNETTIWYDPVTQGWGWGGRDLVDLTGKVKVLENNYGQLGDCSERPQAVLKLAAAASGGLEHWDETATQFFPAVDGGSLGTSTKRIREVALQARAADGTAGTNHNALFQAQDGSVRLTTAGVTSNNDGADVGQYHRAFDPSVTSGTHVWDKYEGQGLNFAATLTGALTVDLTALKVGEEIRIRVGNPASNTISFTFATGGIDWVGGAPTTGTNTLLYCLWRIGSSNIIGVAVEVGV